MASLLPLLLLSILPSIHCSCDSSHRRLLSLAFSSVSGFHPPPPSPTGSCIRRLHLPSQNLSGTLSWMFLRNITTLQSLDLSSNSLDGSIPGSFWSSPVLTAVNLAGNHLGGPLRFENSGELQFLNLSGNRFTAASNLSILRSLKVLDLSHNKLCATPPALNSLPNVEYLDLSNNSMTGEFPSDFPAIAGLRFLNLSYNNLTGEIDSASLDKFGSSAFAKGGIFTYAAPSGEGHKEKKHGKERALRTGLIAAAVGVVIIAAAIAGGLYGWKKRWPEKERREVGEEELGWVREARWGAAVVVFEKPLMELTFGDLVTATSGFGRESLMAEGGRSGTIYRAVLPGDMHVVVRVMERDPGGDSSSAAAAAAAAFKEIGKLRHRNLLPLLGYCISGRERLLLYEYMERGDLHRWLHELPADQPSVEDWTGDTWEESLPSDHRPSSSAAAAAATISGDWPTRHRIALGVARGLAFLHQGWIGSHSPAVHGHLTTSNILLSDDLEPRISDFAGGGGGATAEDDVYCFGVVVMELVTGGSNWPEVEVERIRGVVREGPAAEVVDRRLQWDAEWEKEAVECLRVGYLCTAKSPEKRPAMQQVVALLKDIRRDAAGGVDGDGGASPAC